MHKVTKIVLAVLALVGVIALSACGGPNVYHYGSGEPNITVEEA